MSLRTILASEGLTANELTPQEFMQKVTGGFTAAKTTRIYSDSLNGEHADAYVIAGQRYKARQPLHTSGVTGRGPWAGLPSMIPMLGKFMIVAQPWAVGGLEESAAQGKPMGDWTLQKGKWIKIVEKTPIGQNIIQISNSNKGPSKAWQKVINEGR